MMRLVHALLISCLIGLFASASLADTASLSEDEIEIRAREVGRALRCVVCQNQSIEDSEASLAEDMRRLVRARIQAGDSDAEIIDFMRERYGDYVLLKPPVQGNSYILWFGPLVLLLLMGVGYYLRVRRSSTIGDMQPLSKNEQARLDAILSSKDKRET